jgi:hypothetical protein
MHSFVSIQELNSLNALKTGEGRVSRDENTPQIDGMTLNGMKWDAMLKETRQHGRSGHEVQCIELKSHAMK